MGTIVKSTSVVLHKPCVFNPNGANQEMCERLSRTPVHASRCRNSNCTSRWRAKNVVCAKTETVPLTSTALQLAEERREQRIAVRGQPTNTAMRASTPKRSSVAGVSPSSREGGEWKKILDRVKVAMATSELVSVDPATIRPMPGQPREYFSETSLSNLCQSIREVGQIQAGIIRRVEGAPAGTEFELLDGERRWRAITLEKIGTYRAQLVVIDDEAAPYMIAAIANFNRDGHTPMEVSDAIHKLRVGTVAVPIQVIADLFGFTQHWTYQMHGLQNLHPDVKAMLDPNLPKNKILPVSAAIHISRLAPELQIGLARKVIAKEITVARLRRAVVETGEAHGKPVRTRQLEPRKLLSSFINKSGEAARIAGDMLGSFTEMKGRALLPGPSTERCKLVLKSVEAAIRDLSIIRDVLKG